MKKFYSWYKKHITAAIFTGLILGIITGLLCPHNRQDHSRCHDLFPVHHSTCQPGRTDHPAADPSR